MKVFPFICTFLNYYSFYRLLSNLDWIFVPFAVKKSMRLDKSLSEKVGGYLLDNSILIQVYLSSRWGP